MLNPASRHLNMCTSHLQIHVWKMTSGNRSRTKGEQRKTSWWLVIWQVIHYFLGLQRSLWFVWLDLQLLLLLRLYQTILQLMVFTCCVVLMYPQMVMSWNFVACVCVFIPWTLWSTMTATCGYWGLLYAPGNLSQKVNTYCMYNLSFFTCSHGFTQYVIFQLSWL